MGKFEVKLLDANATRSRVEADFEAPDSYL
jgi:hypothetical protein